MTVLLCISRATTKLMHFAFRGRKLLLRWKNACKICSLRFPWWKKECSPSLFPMISSFLRRARRARRRLFWWSRRKTVLWNDVDHKQFSRDVTDWRQSHSETIGTWQYMLQSFVASLMKFYSWRMAIEAINCTKFGVQVNCRAAEQKNHRYKMQY